MSLRKSVQAPVTVAAWSVSDLSALYAENRSSLIAQARRILRSDADAAEVVQDAFLKFILAAPELDTADRALAYLRTSVNNLCLNVIRATGSRPNLVAIDADTTQERLSEIAAENHIPMDASLAAAEDASSGQQLPAPHHRPARGAGDARTIHSNGAHRAIDR